LRKTSSCVFGSVMEKIGGALKGFTSVTFTLHYAPLVAQDT